MPDSCAKVEGSNLTLKGFLGFKSVFAGKTVPGLHGSIWFPKLILKANIARNRAIISSNPFDGRADDGQTHD